MSLVFCHSSLQNELLYLPVFYRQHSIFAAKNREANQEQVYRAGDIIMILNDREHTPKNKELLFFTDRDKEVLNIHADWGQEIAPEMAEYFCNFLADHPDIEAIFKEQEGKTYQLRETFIQWFQEMFTSLDDEGNIRADRCRRIGIMHVQIGISHQHLVLAMAAMVNELRKRVKADGKTEALKDIISRICTIDLAFMKQVYMEVSLAAVLQETGWTEGLFRQLSKIGAASM